MQKLRNLKGKKIIATVTNPLFHDKRMIRICSALQEGGAEVILVGVNRKGAPKPGHHSFQQQLLKLLFNKGPLFYLEYNLRLLFYLLQHKFDMVISVDLDSLLAGSLAAKLKGKENIYDAHEYFTKVPELKHSPLKRSIWELIARLCKGKYNITVSSSLAEIFKKKYKREFIVIRNLPEKSHVQAETRSIINKKEYQLVYLGYLNEGRGLEEMIETMKILPRQYKLRLIGSGDIEEKLHSMSRKLDLEDRIEITGWIDPKDFDRYLDGADLGLNLLSGTAESYYYSLANKTFEYMHRGIPSLNMNFPEYRQINEDFDCFYLLDELKGKILSQTIQNIFSNPQSLESKSKANIVASLSFSWEEEKQRLVDFVGRIF